MGRLMTQPVGHVVNMNFRMTEADRRAFKAWCAAEGLTLTEGFHEGVALLKGARAALGAADAKSILETITCASVYMIDDERGLRVERRGAETWAVCEGARSVVNRDGAREQEPLPSSRDDDFLARTRFGLPEALRIARRRAEQSG